MPTAGDLIPVSALATLGSTSALLVDSKTNTPDALEVLAPIMAMVPCSAVVFKLKEDKFLLSSLISTQAPLTRAVLLSIVKLSCYIESHLLDSKYFSK